jgi:GNAT superfamily N-acetyltransferase
MATAERLSAFGPPAWRTAAEVVVGEVRTLEEFFHAPDPLTSLLIAVSPSDEPHGFVYLQELQDYFTLERHGHIGIIAVAEQYEGQGAGKALMQASEDWALARGYRKLTLSVFEHNQRARRVYELCGFKPDTIKYLKVL